MGDLGEFSGAIGLFIKTYRWRRIDPVPFTPVTRPLSECRLALVSSAGFVAEGQEPFDESIRGGDPSFREIPSDVAVASLSENHRSQSFDHSGVARDPNLAFPVERVRELEAAGRIGGLARHHLSFMGSITAPGRLVKQTAPAAAEKLVNQKVDVALLVPV